jgi:hypothetical protein
VHTPGLGGRVVYGRQMNDDASARRVPAGPADRTAAASYVAELSAELAVLARHHRLDALGYILEMARLEAENATRLVNGKR